MIFLSVFQGARFIVAIFQGALRPMPPPSIHPSASGLLPTPSMAVQIPTAKVTRQNTAQDFCLFSLKRLTHRVNGGSCFPSPVAIPELSPGGATSRLPLPQPDQSEVLSPRQITPPPSLMRRFCSFTWFRATLLGDHLDFISCNCLILVYYGRLQFRMNSPKRTVWFEPHCKTI